MIHGKDFFFTMLVDQHSDADSVGIESVQEVLYLTVCS